MKIYTEIVENCSRTTLQGKVDFGYKKHYRLDYGNHEFVRRKLHVHEIEGFRAILNPINQI